MNINKNISTKTTWQNIKWSGISSNVFKKQVEIYKLTRDNKYESVRIIQNELIHDEEVKFLATRRVTQENRGKKTPGVDKLTGIDIKDRTDFAHSLHINGNSSPIRRIWIPKPDGSQRPLGIPTIEDRAKQAIVKIVLEPEWEAKFEGNSYGFRPGRSPQKALAVIFNDLKLKAKYVFDADITKCFDRIDHKVLIEKIGTFPLMSNQILSWLKAGILDEVNNLYTEENSLGTPQGGIISPLLCNIALHGMETIGQDIATNYKIKGLEKRESIRSYKLVRFADDFIVIHSHLQLLNIIKDEISHFLSELNLEINPAKSKLVHTYLGIDNQEPGFDFLGANFVHKHTWKHGQIIKNAYKRQNIGYRLNCTPSRKSVRKHTQSLKETTNKLKGQSQMALIAKLNPMIRGWSNYFSITRSNNAFSYCDHRLFWILFWWAKKRHPNKGKQWIYRSYYNKQIVTRKDKNGKEYETIRKWAFSYKHEHILKYVLRNHYETTVKRISNQPIDYSPFNPKYYDQQIEQYQSAYKQALYKRQNGRCRECGQIILPDDPVEVHHVITDKDIPERNLISLQWLVHLHCHDSIHSRKGKILSIVEEEPYDS